MSIIMLFFESESSMYGERDVEGHHKLSGLWKVIPHKDDDPSQT